MPLFKSRVPPFELDRLVLNWLLLGAVRNASQEAAEDLHRSAQRRLGHAPTWEWWIERCEDVASRGRYDVALLGVEFALEASTEPWPELSRDDHGRLSAIRDRLQLRAA